MVRQSRPDPGKTVKASSLKTFEVVPSSSLGDQERENAAPRPLPAAGSFLLDGRKFSF